MLNGGGLMDDLYASWKYYIYIYVHILTRNSFIVDTRNQKKKPGK